ncbi:hypothetical protein [Devriesea agamarum]|uniref:hypothetical protein n=1 Tax=Devriesea agamarum TaxID=472569 RepID=UPI000AB94933|nr:hypothetical protein [Devriesea agamarum]
MSKVVISSLTGERIVWDEDPDEADVAAQSTQVNPQDARLLREVPPHWGNGR